MDLDGNLVKMKLNKLYNRSTTGKISTWEIEVDGNKYRTISGFYGMKLITSEWTICNKKSYNTSEEQAMKQAKAIHKKKVDAGAFEKIEDIDGIRVFNPMLAKDYNDYKGKLKFPLASSVKLDGVRCILKANGMWSRNGKEIISAPHIFESVKHLFNEYPDLILDGELYAEKDVCDFNKIISCVRKIKPVKEDLIESEKYIKYYIYDLPNIDGNKYVYEKRSKLIGDLLYKENNPYLVQVGFEVVKDEKEVMSCLSSYINEGFEGQMIRVLDSFYENKRSKSLMKHKVFFDKEYKIVGVVEGIGKLKGKAGTLKFITEEGATFNSSINGEHSYLEELWNNRKELIGKKATVKFFEMTNMGDKSVPRFPKVIQIDRSWE